MFRMKITASSSTTTLFNIPRHLSRLTTQQSGNPSNGIMRARCFSTLMTRSAMEPAAISPSRPFQPSNRLVRLSPVGPWWTPPGISSVVPLAYWRPNYMTVRSMASNRKVIDAKNAKRLKIQQKKKKNKPAAGSSGSSQDAADSSVSPNDGVTTADSSSQPFLQHQEWVKFQQSISVDGFQTGQTMTATALKKSRGGKQARLKREKELARWGAATTTTTASSSTGGTSRTKFPAIRYSVDETQELLRQAYETLPERQGKRGNRNLRRQANRWKAVRDGRAQYKRHIIHAHERRMEHRKYKRDRVIQSKVDASVQRKDDIEYQTSILKVWAQKMYGDQRVA